MNILHYVKVYKNYHIFYTVSNRICKFIYKSVFLTVCVLMKYLWCLDMYRAAKPQPS